MNPDLAHFVTGICSSLTQESLAGVARKFGVHQRMVRQALKNAIPPSRKMQQQSSPVFDPVRDFIDQILVEDQKAPRKQRHTAHRIYVKLEPQYRVMNDSVF